MTLTDLRDNEALRRELDQRYPLGWRVGLVKGELVILYRMPEKRSEEGKADDNRKSNC